MSSTLKVHKVYLYHELSVSCFKLGVNLKFYKRNSKFCLYRNLNLMVLKICFLKTGYFCLWENILWEGFVQYWVEISRFVLMSNVKTVSYLSSFKKWKIYSFWSLLAGLIFSQVSPSVPQEVADLIYLCQVTTQF